MNNDNATTRGGRDYAAWKHWHDSEFGTFNTHDSLYFSAELRYSNLRLDSETRVLEVGFGNGSFCGWVRQTTSNYVGTESNPVLIERALSAGIEAHPATLDIEQISSGRMFDLIAIFDVLEHIEIDSILTLLQSCKRTLSSQGLILIRVPSGDSPFAAHLFHGDITHKTLLGSMAIRQMAGMLNMQVQAIKEPAFPIAGLGLAVALRKSGVSIVRSMVTRLINAAYHGNEPMVLTPNLVAILSHKHPEPDVRSP